MKVLLTNDDGIHAEGIELLYNALRLEHEVTVVAPSDEQSGVSHAFTFNSPLRCRREDGGVPGYAVDGTPSDCVKLAVSRLMDCPPQAVVSGMNIGENSGVSAWYSGTVAAAREAAFWRLPAFAFSVCESGRDYAAEYARQAAALFDRIMAADPAFSEPAANSGFFNVNFPGCRPEQCRGFRVTRQSLAFFDDRYRRVEDHLGREGFVIYGEKKDLEPSDDYDSRALLNNFVTITPLHFDATSEAMLTKLAAVEGLF